MKTSCYKRYDMMSEEEKDKYIPISISHTNPKWFRDKYKFAIETTFVPKYKYLSKLKEHEIPVDEFIIYYSLQLYDKQDVIKERLKFYTLLEKKTNKEVLLLCYENPNRYCHRQTLGKFFKIKYNLIVSEL